MFSSFSYFHFVHHSNLSLSSSYDQSTFVQRTRQSRRVFSSKTIDVDDDRNQSLWKIFWFRRNRSRKQWGRSTSSTFRQTIRSLQKIRTRNAIGNVKHESTLEYRETCKLLAKTREFLAMKRFSFWQENKKNFKSISSWCEILAEFK